MASQRRIYIGLPAFNEEIALPRLLVRIRQWAAKAGEATTVVIYNDGSTDATLPIAREHERAGELVVLDGVQNKGLGAGLATLVAYATRVASDEDVLVLMDCDDTHDPAQITHILQRIDAGADVVIASRYAKGATVTGVPLLRRLTALGAASLFKFVHPVRRVWDYTCGYRGYRVSVLKRAQVRYPEGLVRESGFACMVELLLKLNSLGCTFAEIPLRLRYDLKPTPSKMRVAGNISRLLTLLTKWRLRGFDRA